MRCKRYDAPPFPNFENSQDLPKDPSAHCCDLLQTPYFPEVCLYLSKCTLPSPQTKLTTLPLPPALPRSPGLWSGYLPGCSLTPGLGILAPSFIHDLSPPIAWLFLQLPGSLRLCICSFSICLLPPSPTQKSKVHDFIQCENK